MFTAKTVQGILENEDGVPSNIARSVASMIVGSDSSSGTSSSSYDNVKGESMSESSSSTDDEDALIDSIKDPKMPATRRRYPKRDPFNSNWWQRYLTDNARAILLSDETHRDTKEFKGLFRISFKVYEELVDMHVKRGWYDTKKTDCVGNLCSNLNLLVLGALHTLANGQQRWTVQSNTNIDKDVHRRFFKAFVHNMASVSSEYISMPRDSVELQRVQKLYSRVGLPGCVGSIDVVHIGWDACPANLIHLFKGKESFPSIAYEVIVNQTREIMSVTVGHPGARNDKHICRMDDALSALSTGWLANQQWWAYCDASDENKVSVEQGYYLICDGGYLRWPTLICPIKVSTRYLKLSKVIESTRKDVEDVFGILKKRFLFLKYWNTLRSQQVIDNAFLTCCILHNIQLRHDGFLDPELPPPSDSALNSFRGRRGDCIWRRDWNSFQYNQWF